MGDPSRGALRLEPDSPAGHLALGTFYLVTRDFDQAEAEFDLAAEAAPTRSGVQIRVVDFYRLLGRTEDASARLDALVAEAPDFLPAWQRIAEYSFADGDYDRCEQALNHIAETTPNNPEVLRMMAEVYRERGDRKAASEKFREAIRVPSGLYTTASKTSVRAFSARPNALQNRRDRASQKRSGYRARARAKLPFGRGSTRRAQH